jgi:hypothetical protein
MRRSLVLSIVGACLLVLAPSSAALGASSTYYAGTNSQGQKLLFTVDQTSSGPMFDPIFINQIARCPVTGDVIGMEYSFQGFLVPIKNGKFSLTLNDLTDLLRWNGTVTSTGATGKESIDLAAFDNNGGLQDCGAGSLAWKAQALVPAASTAAPKAAYVITVTKEANGSVHYSVSH